MPASLKKSIVPTLGEFGDFDIFNGGALDIVQTDYVPAGKNAAEKLTGTHSITDVTLERAFDPQRDLALLDWYNRFQQGKESHRTLTIKYLNPQGAVVKTSTYPKCKPRTCTPPPGASGDNSVANIVLVLGVEAVS